MWIINLKHYHTELFITGAAIIRRICVIGQCNNTPTGPGTADSWRNGHGLLLLWKISTFTRHRHFAVIRHNVAHSGLGATEAECRFGGKKVWITPTHALLHSIKVCIFNDFRYLFLGSAAACFGIGFLGLTIRSFRRFLYRRSMTAHRRMIPRDRSSCNFFEMDDPDRAGSFDSVDLLHQRF